MKLFDVYPVFDIEPVRARGALLWDKQEREYLDFYGGHAVISIGHSHPHYVQSLSAQLQAIGFYSNSIVNPLQEELAQELGRLSGYADWSLFLCNSGAEANENALKLASFHNGRKKILAFNGGFHGRTSAAVAATDNPKIQTPLNNQHAVELLPLNDIAAVAAALRREPVCAIIIEGIQGVGGIRIPQATFLQQLQRLAREHEALLIMDEVQSGCGRSGYFFAHQHAGIEADLVTIAKGFGNGFPVGGVLIAPQFAARSGLLGTTFGGSYLACRAALAVLQVLENENLLANAAEMGNYLMRELRGMHNGIREVRGMGLMIGIEMEEAVGPLRNRLLHKQGVFTGSSADPRVLRLLPPLTIGAPEADRFLQALRSELVP